MNNMTNIYNKTIFENNSIQSVPSGLIDQEANTLFKFLGSFWRNIHEDRTFIQNLQKVRGIKLAQFYLDLLESLKLQDRKGAPVFHRELWKPLILRRSKQDTSQENLLKLSDGAAIGPQPEGSKYGEGTVLSLGSFTALEDYVTYPVEGDIEAIVSGITNNIINPTVTYSVDTEFPSQNIVYTNGTLIFPKDKDPFGENSEFEIYDVIEDSDSADITKLDQETVLWASNTLIDKNYIADHLAYALGVNCPSTYIVKRILNTIWDSVTGGLTPEFLRSILAALVNIPVIQETSEQVIDIITKEDQTKEVKTDKHTYTIYKNAVLRDCVKIGAELHRGDLLDQSIKIYPLLSEPTQDKIDGTVEYASILKQDIPVISIPKTLLRTRTANGLAVNWEPTDVLWEPDNYDKNNHRRLYFNLGGSEEDVQAFWEDVWEYTEQHNIDLDEIFEACEPEVTNIGDDSAEEPVWQVIPAAFFLKHMLGGNTLIITVDRSQIEDISLLRDSIFFNLLNEVLPAGLRLFFIEHLQVGDDKDTYTLSGDSPSAEDTAEMYALEDIDEDDDFYYNDLPGIRGKRLPTYEDQVELKFFRNRKRSAN